MTAGEAADDLVVADCGKAHGGDAAALRAVWITAELTGGDDGFEIGGDGMSGPGEDAVCRGLGRVQEFLQRGFVHVEDGIEGGSLQNWRNCSR